MPGDTMRRLTRKGTVMSDQPGITMDDLTWIRRDQFVYYLEMARALGDPNHWPRFRDDLLRALTAAFSLDVDDPDAGWTSHGNRQRALHVLELVASRHDPDSDWRGFFDELWASRGHIRPDLAPAADRRTTEPQRALSAPVSQRAPVPVDSLDDPSQKEDT